MKAWKHSLRERISREWSPLACSVSVFCSSVIHSIGGFRRGAERAAAPPFFLVFPKCLTILLWQLFYKMLFNSIFRSKSKIVRHLAPGYRCNHFSVFSICHIVLLPKSKLKCYIWRWLTYSYVLTAFKWLHWSEGFFPACTCIQAKPLRWPQLNFKSNINFCLLLNYCHNINKSNLLFIKLIVELYSSFFEFKCQR